ncbi:uncharacterized protein si:dkey-187a12.4 isoform X1 [Neoarius graeffei]|uniref:uncharacterized protein si:dkey-187a12.4 isoform X1 n=1 Tax=Neoarius graeffei TaxID=443677 RepID=UPI00298D3DC7|nr:uncharacterized protein si:dkey-187a12.4 isoform X1 [Neoarius graeffei]
MEGSNGKSSSWAMERRVEGLVNKHMADMALETLQQRLSAVSQEMNHLSAEISRREDSKRVEDLPRRSDSHFIAGSLPESYNEELVEEKKLMANTSSSSSSADGDSSKSDRSTEWRIYPAANPLASRAQSTLSASSPLLEKEAAAQRKIISLLLEIKEEQQRQWAVLKDLQAMIQGHMCEEDVETLDIDLPLQTMEQLDETEKYLENDGAQKRMVSHLSRMGGATVDDAVRRLMQAVLSFSVGSELNWVGRGQKRSFRNTRLQGVLFRALKKTPVGKEATHHQFADVVKKWLRFAPFRQGGSGRRQHYKPPVEFMCPKYHTDTEG